MSIIQWLKDATHNCIVHPLMQFMPAELATRMHDTHANWAFGLDRFDEIALEKPEANSTNTLVLPCSVCGKASRYAAPDLKTYEDEDCGYSYVNCTHCKSHLMVTATQYNYMQAPGAYITPSYASWLTSKLGGRDVETLTDFEREVVNTLAADHWVLISNGRVTPKAASSGKATNSIGLRHES